MEIKDFADAMAKAIALNNERAKVIEDFRSKVDLAKKADRLIGIRNQYTSIANWLLLEECNKGYHTIEDKQLGKLCIDGIKACDNELGNACSNYMIDKMLSKRLSYQS